VESTAPTRAATAGVALVRTELPPRHHRPLFSSTPTRRRRTKNSAVTTDATSPFVPCKYERVARRITGSVFINCHKEATR